MPNIIKTIIEKVSAPMADADDFAPTDSEALELAEEELDANKTALEQVDAENDRLAKALREAEEAVAYLHLLNPHRPITDANREIENRIYSIAMIVGARKEAPRFTRK
ncbi:hypothetical protein IVB12_15750 [Bradyrhizobium sp. 179]|uniref:hypothetical protein n=1 Tax=Bradyrhizobium sp. 179 TaxID=2782648 RepID=UPI001FFBD371|nr:hypothetical protein [Bradyrhizobium sp. 179]MCK1543370.1 hypothetical protein [Bradyrhizobium sp. 179]